MRAAQINGNIEHIIHVTLIHKYCALISYSRINNNNVYVTIQRFSIGTNCEYPKHPLYSFISSFFKRNEKKNLLNRMMSSGGGVVCIWILFDLIYFVNN